MADASQYQSQLQDTGQEKINAHCADGVEHNRYFYTGQIE